MEFLQHADFAGVIFAREPKDGTFTLDKARIGPPAQGAVDDLPSGNVDLAPTILHILGINATEAMDGRVLFEAMSKIDKRTSETETIEATQNFRFGTWRQYFKISRVGSTIYLDEGNGNYTASKTEND